MGLDMFLIKRKKKIKDDSWNEVMYWRKANAIHRWFVENVQNDVDDCGEYKVSRKQLEDLYEKCRKILVGAKLESAKIPNGYTYNNAGQKVVCEYIDGSIITNADYCEKILPTQEGFFFGNTEYNNWYYDSIRETFFELDKILQDFDFDEYDLIYTSSW